ncbi:hypothetical protein CEXT_316961 [Caerostris extrusa]|uniref:Homeobox domain-containing protein n=1 Tax=Caerostris extrusa TaxID=172846 RepID=A0AAV4WER2_CAEEX|nr:hypothetical protein CEXT_316961 [Caerostris extrusa]
MPQHNDLEHLLSLAGFMKYNESQSLPNNPSLQRPLSNEPLQHSSTSSRGPFLVNNSLPDCNLVKKRKISKSYQQVVHAMMATDCFLEDDEPDNPEMQIVSGVKLPEELAIRILREYYHDTRYPNITTLKELSRIIGYSEKTIRIWFRNKRKLEKFRAFIERQQ